MAISKGFKGSHLTTALQNRQFGKTVRGVELKQKSQWNFKSFRNAVETAPSGGQGQPYIYLQIDPRLRIA